jgi:hypothetical protein
MNAVYETYFRPPYPARATVQVADTATPRAYRNRSDCLDWVRAMQKMLIGGHLIGCRTMAGECWIPIVAK